MNLERLKKAKNTLEASRPHVIDSIRITRQAEDNAPSAFGPTARVRDLLNALDALIDTLDRVVKAGVQE